MTRTFASVLRESRPAQVPTSRVEESLGVLLQSGYRIIDGNGMCRQQSILTTGLGLFEGEGTGSPAVPIFPPGELPTMLRFTTSATPKSERPRLSLSITGLPNGVRDRSRSTSSDASTMVSSISPAFSPTSTSSHPLLPISVLPGSFAMVGLTPHATHSWTSLMIKLFLHPRLLYPSYWELPDGPPCLGQEPVVDVDLFSRLGLACGACSCNGFTMSLA